MYRLLFILGLTLLSSSAHAWPGFTWEQWQKDTGEKKPLLDTPQAGEAELLPLLKTSMDAKTSISTTAEWEAKRAGILDTIGVIMGTPTDIKRDTGGVKILGEEKLEKYRRVHLRIPGEMGDSIPAYLLLPFVPLASPAPAMIVLHQTQAPGKKESCGMIGDPDMAFAHELAELGFVCIVPDAIGFGERIPEGEQPYHGSHDFYDNHPKWSFFGKMNWDISRVVDYLETRNDVDLNHLGVIGHSHGAYGSIMATLHEPRIQLTVASCGFTTLRTDPRQDRWSHLTALMPRVGYYVDDIKMTPFDWHELVACIAPRPYFNWATLNDTIFPETDNLADVYTQLEGVYALYDAQDKFHGELVPGKHRFPDEGRQQVFSWIKKQWELE
jgi:dienelactone hydrolase